MLELEVYNGMRIEYTRLFDIIKKENITQKEIKANLKLSNGVFDNLRHNKPVTTETIGKLCEFLRVQPSDIMEIIYDDGSNSLDKIKIEREIASLQAKLKQM